MKYILIFFKIIIAAAILNFSWAGQYETSRSIDLKGNIESQGVSLFLWQELPYYAWHKVYNDPSFEKGCAESCIEISALSLANQKPLILNISKAENYDRVYQVTIDVLLLGVFVSLFFLVLLFRFVWSIKWLRSKFLSLIRR